MSLISILPNTLSLKKKDVSGTIIGINLAHVYPNLQINIHAKTIGRVIIIRPDKPRLGHPKRTRDIIDKAKKGSWQYDNILIEIIAPIVLVISVDAQINHILQ